MPRKLYKVGLNTSVVNKASQDRRVNLATDWLPHEITADELASHIRQGFAFSAQFRDEYRRTANFICADFIAADFDGTLTRIELPHAGIGTDKPRFLMKVRHFLKAHADHITIQKLYRNEQLTQQDLSELERILRDETEASDADIAVVTSDGGLGLFIRSLIGLDRDAAKDAFAEVLAGQNLNANQIEFINLIIDYLTERGAMDPRRLYESPFTDFDDQGISGLFPQIEVQRIVQVLNEVRGRAAA